jgi:chromosome segregation ATPase
MMEYAKALAASVRDNMELTTLLILSWLALAGYSHMTYASKQDFANGLEAITEEVQETKQTLNSITIEIKRSSLQAQRRDLTRQIQEIEDARESGTASSRELNSLPSLRSDLQDINDELDKLPAETE